MKKELTAEQLEKQKKLSKKILKYFLLPAFIIVIIFVIIVPKSSNNEVKYRNIDSLIVQIKNDTFEQVKDVYYNQKDSTLHIAISNKNNSIKSKLYAMYLDYYNETFHIDSLYNIDGISIYEYKKGYSFENNDYIKPLIYNSRKIGRLSEEFKSKFYNELRGTYQPVYDYLKENLNDPSSLKIEKSFFIGMNEDNTFKVKTTFRAKNAFGAYILQMLYCDINMDGNIINSKFE